jgi:hypothetical protein
MSVNNGLKHPLYDEVKNRINYLEVNNDCIDWCNIKFLITLYDSNNDNDVFDDIFDISSDLGSLSTGIDPDLNKKAKIIKDKKFKLKYTVFLKILYCVIILEVSFYKKTNDCSIARTLGDLKNSFLKKKKNSVTKMIEEFKENSSTLKKLNNVKYDQYTNFANCHISIIKIIDKVISIIDKLINHNIIKESDTVLDLLMPYFYDYHNYIEIYSI